MENKELIKQLLETLDESLMRDVDKIPDDWNGKQIRCWVADRAEEVIASFELSDEEFEEYENDRRVKNL